MTDYYVSTNGSDSNDGMSPQTPWQTLAKTGSQKYQPGDKILLKCSDEWNEELRLVGSNGSANNPIAISSYGDGDKPKIRRNKRIKEVCLFFENPSDWVISNLDISNAMEGIVFNFTKPGNKNIRVENCQFHQIEGLQYPGKVIDDINYISSAGIMICGKWGKEPLVENLMIDNCKCYDFCNCLWWVSGMSDEELQDGSGIFTVKNFVGKNCHAESGSFGWWMFGVQGGEIFNTTATRNGAVDFEFGPCAAGIEHCEDIEVYDCEFSYCKCPRYDGCGLDLEGGGNNNIRVHDCVFKYNDCYGLMIFGKQGGSRNCTITKCTFIKNYQNPPENLKENGPWELRIWPDVNSRITIKNNKYQSLGHVNFVNIDDAIQSISQNNQPVDNI
jgi:hypothetical protein